MTGFDFKNTAFGAVDEGDEDPGTDSEDDKVSSGDDKTESDSGEEKSSGSSAGGSDDETEAAAEARIKNMQLKPKQDKKKEKGGTDIGKMQEDICKQSVTGGGGSLKTDDAGNRDPVELVDDNMKRLLQACMKLKKPNLEDLKDKMVTFGEKNSQKLLILDMDETLIHAQFHNETYEELEA